MANEKIKIDLEVVDNLEATTGNVRALKRELRGLEAGGDEFLAVQAKINEMNRSVQSAKLGAQSFTEVLGKIPGPLGEIGDKASGTIGILRLFSGVRFDDLKNSFSVLGGEVTNIIKGFGNLTGITQGYQIANQFLAKSFTAIGVAEETAAVGATIFASALAATGVTVLIAGIGFLIEKLMHYGDAAKEAKKQQDDLNKSMAEGVDAGAKAAIAFINTEEELAIKRAEIAGKSEKELQKIRDEYSDRRKNTYAKELADLQKIKGADTSKAADAEAAESDKKLLSDLEFQNKAAAKKREQAKKDREQAKKDREDARKIEDEAYTKTLSERESELYKLGEKYNEDRAKLVKAGIKDFTTLNTAYRDEEAKINKKYDDKAIADAKKAADDKKAALKKQFEEEKSELELQHQKGYLTEKDYIDKLYKLKVKYAEGQVDLNNAEIERVKGLEELRKKDVEDAKKWADEQKAVNKAIAQSWVDLGTTVGSSFSELANLFEKGSDAAKAFGVISVLINAATSIGKINMAFADSIAEQTKTISLATATVEQGALYASNPFTAVLGAEMIAVGTGVGSTASAQLGLLSATKTAQEAAVVISSGAQIAAILSASKSSTGVATTGASAGSGPSAPTYGGGPKSMATPQIQAPSTNAANPATQIGQSLQNAQSQPIRAYVVSSDISTQQQLDRKVNRAATFGLG